MKYWNLLIGLLIVAVSTTATASPLPVGWTVGMVADQPTAYILDNTTNIGITNGVLYPEEHPQSAWWLYYQNASDSDFIVVAVIVDDKLIASCNMNNVVCEYVPAPTPVGGLAFMSISSDQIEQIQNGMVLSLVIEKGTHVDYVTRSLVGAAAAISKLTRDPSRSQSGEVDEWVPTEMEKEGLGTALVVGGRVDNGLIFLTYSHLAFREKTVDIKDFAGIELSFIPVGTGRPHELKDAYWMSNGARIDNALIEVLELCKLHDNTNCVIDDSLSLIFSETDVTMMRIGKTLAIEWVSTEGDRFISYIETGTNLQQFFDIVRTFKHQIDVGT